jgi:DNA-binding beta-propeller fold protein YncE
MRRLSFCLVAVVGALVAAPAALGDGPPLPVIQGGSGVASHDGKLHYVTVYDGRGRTIVERIAVAQGAVFGWNRFKGSWGIPILGAGDQTGQGLSRDGRTLVLASTAGPYAATSRFLVVDVKRMQTVRTIALRGSFSFDALSPDGSRMYLIQYASAGDVSHYVVRAYDMRSNRLLPGKIADRSEDEKSMAGSAMTRTSSANGRWVYTLYEKPSGEPFVHALDTVGGVAYCVDLPRNRGLYNIVLSLRDRERTLAVHWRSGRPWLDVAVGTWKVSYPGGGFPWTWVAGGIGGGVALPAAGALLLRRRRREELHEHARQELGLA